jgi:ATP-dependent protease ClpP protease subunit
MEETKRKLTTSTRVAYIDIDGVLGVAEEEQFGTGDSRISTYERFAEALEEIAAAEEPIDRLVLNIRSTGGCLADALLIYDATRELGVEVVTRCYGYVASAATIIAQAASKGCREISANSLYLIHCCESSVEGNTHSLSATKELLDKSDERLAEIYSLASGFPAEEFRELMNRNSGKGVWLSPQEAVDAHLADIIIAAAPITDNASSLIEALGLTPLPGRGFSERVAEAWRTLLGHIGLTGDSMPMAAAPSRAESRERSTPPVPPSRLHTARATRTLECDDPTPYPSEGDTLPEGNSGAYAADALALREAIARGK